MLSKISIRTRLTLFYSLAAFILLTVIALFLYWESINILYKADYQFLSDEVDTIQYILHNKSVNQSELKREVLELSIKPDDTIYRYYIRIINENEKTVIQTPGLEKILPFDKSYSKNSHSLSRKNYRWYTNNNTNYLIIQSPIFLTEKKLGIIQIVLDISYQHAVISDRKIFIFVIFGSTLCSLLLGLFITHRGIKSLYVLTETARKITATSLHQRIDPKSWPKELRTLGVAFNQMLDRIESSFVRLKQFSSDLAHELRIPINNMIGETEITLSRLHNINEYQQVLMSNLEELQRVTQLIENILFLSRAENPQLEIKKNLLDIKHEIDAICEYYLPMADEKNIAVSCEGNAYLSADPIMFRRTISNILSNALKYTPPGGQIDIRIALVQNQVQIILSDNGIGISAEHLPKIFDRFYRVDTARSQQSGGTGLGLAIVKSIVDLHQGTISITSHLEKGTRICLVFPK
jgi:two-component system heavy metal sensor histidine kinase CusS